MKIFRAYEPIYRATVNFLFDCTHDDVNKWFKKKKINHSEIANRAGLTMSIEDDKGKTVTTEYLVVVYRKEDFYTLSHELIHLVKDIFLTTGVPFNSNNDETIAYYHEFWLKRLWRIMNKSKNKPKKKVKK